MSASAPTVRGGGPLLTGHLALAMGIGPMAHYALSALGPAVVDDLSLSATQFGSLWLVAFAAASIGTPIAGRVTDRIGARRMLFATFAFAGAAIVTVSASHDLPWLLVGVSLAGLSMAVANPATNLAVMRGVARGRQGVVVGAKQSGVQASQLLAGLLLPPLAAWWGWRNALLSAVLLALLGLISTRWAAPPESPSAPGSTSAVMSRVDPAVWWLTGYAFVIGAVIQLTNVYLPLYAHDELGHSLGQAGLIAAVLGGTGVVARLGWGRVIDRVENVPVLLGVLALLTATGIGLVVLADPGPDLAVWIGAAVFGFSALAANAVIMSAVVRSSEPGTIGRATAWAALGLYLGFMAGPVTFGTIVDASSSYLGAWAFAGALSVVLIVLTACWCAPRCRHRLDSHNSVRLPQKETWK